MAGKKTQVGLPPAPHGALGEAPPSRLSDAPTEEHIVPDEESISRARISHIEAATSPTVMGASPVAAPLQPGSVLQGSYQLREELGRGGMGAVYVAKDLGLNRDVAIKVPSTPQAGEMMCQEAQALAAFNHRGLPAVYALGRHGGLPFIVMERIRGRTLEQFVEERHREGGAGVTVVEAIDMMVRLIEVVSLLHEANLAHRDLKPDNVMVAPGDRIVVLDLGIVRQERFIGDEHSVSGSPNYMAPEAVKGSVRMGEAHYVDLYALGVTAYQLLTGRAPYDSEHVLEIMDRQLHAEVPRISDSRDVPPLLDDIVHELMGKMPEDRPPGIGAVSEIFAQLKLGRESMRRRPQRFTPVA